MEKFNNRPVTISIEWFLICKVKSKQGKMWKEHHLRITSVLTASSNKPPDVWLSAQLNLNRKGHKLLHILKATPEMMFAFYNDDPQYPFLTNSELKQITLPEPFLNFTGTDY